MIERISALMRVGGGISSSSSSSSSSSTNTSSCRASSTLLPFTPAATGIGVVVVVTLPSSSSSSSSFAKQQQHLTINNTTHSAPNNIPVMLACSSTIRSQEHREMILGMRKLCEDRRGVVDHLYPKKLLIGAVRVTVTQATQLYSNYLNDQLHADMKRDELVRQGKLSPVKAEEEEEDWIQTEWNHRIQAFPQKLCTAYMKYHAITLVMRLYEEIASRFVSNVMLDKLTLDTFASAKRRQRENNNSNNNSNFSIKEMTREGWYANLIAFMADYSVHQVILAYGYYVYIRQHRLEKRQKRLAASAANEGKEPTADNDNDDDDPLLHPGSLVLSFTKKSTLLALSRIIALAMASVGGALGTMIFPGWGTLAGTNFGDGIAASLTDDFVTDL